MIVQNRAKLGYLTANLHLGDALTKSGNYFLSHIHEYDNSYALDLADFLPHNMKAKGIL